MLDEMDFRVTVSLNRHYLDSASLSAFSIIVMIHCICGFFPLLGRDAGKKFTIPAEPNPFVNLLNDVR
jgi:hypothetical protein